MRTTSHNKIINYFEQLATEHTLLDYFYRFNWNEIKGNLRYMGKGYVLLLESHSGDLSKQQGASTRNNRVISGLVLRHSAVDDYDGQNESFDTSEQIVLDLVARIQEDSKGLRSTDPLAWLKGFDAGSVRYDSIPTPYFQSYYGYNFIIELPNPAEICYTAEVAARFGITPS